MNVVRITMVIVAALVGALAPSRAAAEDIASYEADGDADAGGSDPRVAALDEAFGRAVASAMQDLVDAEARKANKQAIDREIVGRARLWVAKFTVTKDETADGRRQLTVMVRVDRDKLRVRLAELNITAHGGGETAASGSRTAIVLLRVTEPEVARASFGAAADKDVPGLGALSSVLRAGGVTVKRAPAGGAAVKPGGELPLDDDAAEALAGEAKADTAAIAGVTVGAPVAVRGLAAPAVLVTARVRLVSRGKQVVGESSAVVAARGSEPSLVHAAIERALVAAAGDVLPPAKQPAAPQAFQGDDTPLSEAGVVLVRLPAKTPWALVAAEVKHLTGAKGIARAALRRVSPNGWVIGVTTAESVQKVAQIARKPPATDTAAQVKVVGDIVELSLSGAP